MSRVHGLREPHNGVILQPQTGEELDALSFIVPERSEWDTVSAATIGDRREGVQGKNYEYHVVARWWLPVEAPPCFKRKLLRAKNKSALATTCRECAIVQGN